MTVLTDTFDLLDDDGPDVYRALLREAPITGRCPIWVTTWAAEVVSRLPDDERAARLLAVARADPGVLLGRQWRGPCAPTCCPAPLPAWPGVLARDAVPDDLLVAAADRWARERFPSRHLAVVPAARPADIPAVTDWRGACNYGTPGHEISAVLRSWEERFGAVLVELDGMTVHLAVADPPTTHADARRVAAEHFAFCPDQQDPQNGYTWFGLDDYAATIRGARLWRFWWD